MGLELTWTKTVGCKVKRDKLRTALKSDGSEDMIEDLENDNFDIGKVLGNCETSGDWPNFDSTLRYLFNCLDAMKGLTDMLFDNCIYYTIESDSPYRPESEILIGFYKDEGGKRCISVNQSEWTEMSVKRPVQ